ncbi:Two-component response regulator [Clostridium pasteurianum DSM 525 = ATCC 6013]|uniref:Stage 0 sporulation protein A homolog n=1 Tax=Clostridium pasteurianum DSM 525 = ATCC 6013 TaxID=1262449 RepID=A0A0H3IZL3_CLOPA|nr:response regulator transcription factor [Clostridium pasteurianum]AJA46976.1 Two-component response regulator [Clostridium pasteurianum DSM 525 = ATCC 6013]AJA50964.1 Two-component response regulator [Clostridium pasteurianum DSM 525 = ATCC 6013]AOZ74354.1 LuxR family transcriptional regulator [Clostridium pasteurianum DSM 525 = ATCC 6013]AOZ78152.1 LuxR family transcriptional regulator [Clostridium pasteurianum]ELP58227.1 two-component response regulator [Clostridium pasteurianum DSM 525 =
MEEIKIIIADDEKLIRSSLNIIIGSDPAIKVVGLCGDGEEAYNFCRDNQVDVALMDIRMPKVDGVYGTKLIKEVSPDTKVLILTTFNDDEYIFDAMKFGASGYLLKDTSHEVIIDSIKGVHLGNVIMNPVVASRVIENTSRERNISAEDIKSKFSLTSREIDVIKGISEGLTNKEISKKLFVTEGTVKNYITEILSKLSLRDRTQIAIFAFKNNITSNK